ncbi:hypothetical protein PF008_g10640 [Phytophthora fragariae]|uniref:BZIP domain-containing protein n=1 Tax=Phytophthora fragariae TaxID=53985 RepID=A0A6G0RU22_9STRA|nr:hypothetical protein PF008_g10640 [Phytophthora fragariae]
MADLLMHDKVSLDDIIRLLDFDAPLTPKVSATCIESLGGTNVSNRVAPSLARDAGDTSSSSASGDDISCTNNRRVKREKEAARQRRHRQRLKDDRVELQSEAAKLSKQLEALAQEAARKKRKTTETTESQLTRSHWSNQASVQRKLRLKSEAQRRELVSVMNYQAEYISSLREMYRTRLKANSNGGMIHSMSSMSYTTCLLELEGCYARVDTVMNACGMASLPQTSLSTVHRRKADGGVEYFQQANKSFLPFTFQQTCDVIWRIVHERDEKPFGDCEGHPDIDVFVKYRVLKAMGIGSLAQRYVSRQYREENRMVLVWKMSSEGEDGFRGLYAEETGWICVEPSPGGVVISVCVQQVPMCFRSPFAPEPAIKPFYHMLKNYLEADKEDMATCMGRMLLDDVLTGIEC